VEGQRFGIGRISHPQQTIDDTRACVSQFSGSCLAPQKCAACMVF
jgi:hypothetical protein